MINLKLLLRNMRACLAPKLTLGLGLVKLELGPDTQISGLDRSGTVL